jgi:hypothetical protein
VELREPTSVPEGVATTLGTGHRRFLRVRERTNTILPITLSYILVSMAVGLVAESFSAWR